MICIETTDQARTEKQLRDRNQALEQRIAERKAQVKSLADALAMAEQHEQRRISQTLHDDLQQMLYSVLLRMQMIEEWLTREEPKKGVALLHDLSSLMQRAINLTRSLATDLNPPTINSERLEEGVAWLADHIARAYGLEVGVSAEQPCRVGDPDLRALLLCTIRELLFNVVKHAGTGRAHVVLSQANGLLVARIEDDGVGFDSEAAFLRHPKNSGIGLFSIAERLRLIGGQLVIDSEPGHGTRIALIVPVEES